MVKDLSEYPYSSYHYFLNSKIIPQCLKNSWIVQNFQSDLEEIKTFLNASVDTAMLQELKKASSLVEASNTDKKPDEETIKTMLLNVNDIKERNTQILKAYSQGY